MNCKPDQLAWIVVPRAYLGTGLEQIDGHVVKTVRMLNSLSVPVWVVTPTQTVTFRRFSIDDKGNTLLPGETGRAEGIPDSWLRPFDPEAAPRESIRVLELLA